MSLKDRERARIKRARGRIHEVLVRRFPTCRRLLYLRKAEEGDDAEEDDEDEAEDGEEAGEEEVCVSPFYNRLREQPGQRAKGRR